MSKTMEMIILKNLTTDESFTRKVIPFLKEEYFTDTNERIVFTGINNFVVKYNALPTPDILLIAINNLTKVSEESVKESCKIVEDIRHDDSEKPDAKWLLDQTEKFCQKQAIYNAVLESIHILDEKSKQTKDEGAIPGILQDALSVSFDTNVGHDYFEDSDKRFDHYHNKERKFICNCPWSYFIVHCRFNHTFKNENSIRYFFSFF